MTEQMGPSAEEMGMNPETNDNTARWATMQAEGWEFLTNGTGASHSMNPGELGNTIKGLKEKYGDENVRVGTSFNSETGQMEARPGLVGIYIRKSEGSLN